MRKAVTDDLIIKFSVSILITMGVGLVLGTSYIVTLSNASDLHRTEIEELKIRQSSIDSYSADIAVIKQRLDSIDKKLDK